MRSITAGEFPRESAGAVMQSFTLEDLRSQFFNPRDAGLGLFGGGKVDEVGSLSAGCEGCECFFQGRVVFELILQFVRKLRFRFLLQIYLTACFLQLDGFQDVALHNRFEIIDFLQRCEPDQPRSPRVLAGSGENLIMIFQQGTLEETE